MHSQFARSMLLNLLILATTAMGQFQSAYLNNPDLLVGYVDSCARFWFDSYDEVEGGFYTNVDRSGNVITAWGTNKNLLTQSRNAYGMARAFQMTGDTIFLAYMQGALDFQYAHAWDEQYGGWFELLTEDGSPISPQNNKTAFTQHYGLLGPVAAWVVTRDTTHWNQIQLGQEDLETHWYDSRPDYLGYFDERTRSGTNRWDKSFNATVDALTTHLLPLIFNTGDSGLRQRASSVGEQVLDHLVTSMPQQAIGFAEKYTSLWDIQSGETMTIMGHVLKSAWCLGRLEQIAPAPDWIPAARQLADNVLDRGYDHALGGPYKDYNRVTGEMLMWGNPDTAKAWWQMEQAVMAGLQLFDLTGDTSYLQMADETLDFFIRYFVDHTYGEVYADRTRYGEETWGTTKGGSGKAGYHSIELGYYTYLYSKLFLRGETASIYYRFRAGDVERSYLLTPLAIADDRLQISQVELEGEAYPDYNPIPRQLHLAPGVGGVFRVWFETVPAAVSDRSGSSHPDRRRLASNYPNPFNSGTVIQLSPSLPQTGDLTVFDLGGHPIVTLPLTGGKAVWDGRDSQGLDAESGLYLYRVSTSGLPMGRMLLLR